MIKAHAEATDLSYRAIREWAERIGVEHGMYDDDGCLRVGELLDVLGGTVEICDSTESLRVRGKGDFTINLPSTTSTRRDRFTIAHELGHYFLHYRYRDEQGEKTYGRGGRSVAETEANVFAASLLMPEGPFIAAYQDLGGDLWRIASRFEVSPAAAEVRAKTVGLLS